VTSRVTVVLALIALVGVTPVALSSAARSRALGDDAPSAEDASAEQAAQEAAASTADDATPAPARSPRPARRGFGVARLHRSAVLRGRPGGAVAAQVGSVTQFGSPQVLSVARRRGPWLGVVSTALPNGKLGWLRSDDPALSLSRVRYSLHADLSARRLELRRGGRRIARMSVAVGRPGSATPTGRFAVTDKLDGSRYGAYYGCCILALSGHQPNLPLGWRGGNRLAIHGTNAPGSIGQASSAGCLRASDASLRTLMRRVPLGTPTFIRA
jgi:L,D-transpeptidase catalytic domain